MREFRVVDNKYLLRALNFDDTPVQVRIHINNTDFETVENINWGVVDGTIQFIMNNKQELITNANQFLKFLVDKSGLYDNETIEKVKGFQLHSIELKDCFGKYSMAGCIKYLLQFHLISDYSLDTYGLLNVIFMNKHVVGVERIQS